MNKPNEELAETLIRIGKALLVYLLLGGALIGLIFWLTGDFQNASITLRSQFLDAEDAEASVLAILDQARMRLVNWTGASFATSFICASLFLSFAQRRRPRNPVEGASHMARWVALLLVTIVATAAFWWQFVSVADIASVLVSKSYVLVLCLVGLGIVFTYYLATGFAVTRTMKPSVPLASILPDFWN